MIEQIIKKIKLCLPKKYKQLNVHEPIFEEKDIILRIITKPQKI